MNLKPLRCSRPRARMALTVLAGLAGNAHAGWGDFDPTYGTGGAGFVDIGGTTDSAFAAAVDATGNLYIAGASTPTGNTGSGIAIAKLDPNGHAVATFGTGGHVFSDLVPQLSDRATALTLGADGSLYVAGVYPQSSSSADFFVAKLDGNGHFATAFGTGGVATVDVGNDSNDIAHAIAVDHSGNIYVAGVTHDGTRENASVIKLDGSGHSVAAFGNGGRLVLDLSWPSNADALAFDHAGHLIVAGSLIDNDSAPYAVILLDANGNRISSFGEDGVALAADAGGYEYCAGVVVDSSGNIYVGGTARIDDQTYFSAAKIDANGTADSDFAAGGLAVINMGSGLFTAGNALAMDREEHLLIAGTVAIGTDYKIAVAALNLSGSTAFEFGDGGQRTFHLGSTDFDVGYALAIDPRTRGPIIAGYSTAGSGTNDADFVAVRLLAGAPLDPVFASGFDP